MLLLIAGVIVGITGMLFVDFVRGRRTRVVVHQHIWDNWEELSVAIYDKNGKKNYDQAAQSRKCLGCNYEEWEKLGFSC